VLGEKSSLQIIWTAWITVGYNQTVFKIGKDKQKFLTAFILFLIIAFGLSLRFINIGGNNLVLDYDQLEDQLYTYTIAVDHKLAIIGRAVYGDPRLHHGVFYYYYNLIPFFISGGSLFASTYWNIFLNAASGIVIFILAFLLFSKRLPGLISAFIATSSFEFIKFSNWLTIDTPAIFLIPLFYLGLAGILKKKNWGFLLSSLSLGLAIQSDLSLIYLIPVSLIFVIIFRPPIPKFKILFISTLIFLFTISTLILTEIKLHFAGVLALLNFSNTFSGVVKLNFGQRISLFLDDFFKNFSSNLVPQRPNLGIYLAILAILAVLYHLFSKKTKKEEKSAIIFLLFYLLSPAITLILGYHDTPWFLIGLPGAIALICGYAISKLKLFLIIPLLFAIGFTNASMIFTRPNEAYKLFDNFYDKTSYLSYQLKAVDYTYRNSNGQPFSINAVTCPLYYNAMWAYLYNWYGKDRYGYTPTWLGGDQLHPYDLLTKSNETEKVFYMIISDTPKIQEWSKDEGKIWAKDHGKLIEEKEMEGFTILKMEKEEGQ
jgi:hypothetical protein